MDVNHHDHVEDLVEVCVICNIRGREAIEACPCTIMRTLKLNSGELDELDKKWSQTNDSRKY